MYDVSGASEETWASDILRDWNHVMTDLNATASPSWQYHNGAPVLAVWGLGFTDHPGTAEVRTRMSGTCEERESLRTFDSQRGVKRRARNDSSRSQPEAPRSLTKPHEAS